MLSRAPSPALGSRCLRRHGEVPSARSIAFLALAVSLAPVVGCEHARPTGSLSMELRRAPPSPEVISLKAEGAILQVHTNPYTLSLVGEEGRELLRSTTPSDGYSALSWAHGEVKYSRVLIAGYTAFEAKLQPWQAQLRALEHHVSRGATTETLRLVLIAEDGRRVEVVHELSPGVLRVAAKLLDGQPPRAWSSGFAAEEGEGFLGFGERFNRTDQRGKSVWSWIEEGGVGTGEGRLAGPDNPMPSGEMMTYYAVPFFLSTRGYAVWLDTTYRSQFDLGSERSDAWRAWHVGHEHAYEVYWPSSGDPRPWTYQLIDRFTERTGRPMLPPAWAFGPRRRVGRGAMHDGKSEISAMRELDLAVTGLDDALHFYPSASHVGREEELRSWVASATRLGYRVNGYYNSFVDRDPSRSIAPWARQGLSHGYFLRLDNGSLPDLRILTGKDTPALYLVDFTNPGAASWYASSFEWALSLGYSGWMYDFGEYVPASARGFDGSSGQALHNLYPVLYAKTLHDALESSPVAGDWLAFQRSGYTGSSAYVPFTWSGDPAASFEDADGLPSMVRAGVNLGISGVPHWGSDIGGFHCIIDGHQAADEELVARWIQLGSMSSNMMDQSSCVGAERRHKASIWSSPVVQDVWRKYARLHTRLFPYLYTLAHEARATGAPLMRHPFLEHPDQPDLRGVDDGFYFGPALYIAPVVQRGARRITRRLPPGSFVDWSAAQLIRGDADHSQRIEIDAPLEKLPILLRENHLVPLLDASIDTLSEESSPAVVGPADVADVYDVVGYLTGTAPATTRVYDGTKLRAALDGPLELPPQRLQVASEKDIDTCLDCYRIEHRGALDRLRVSTTSPRLQLGGLTLTATGPRRIRWELYLPASLPPAQAPAARKPAGGPPEPKRPETTARP